MNLDDSSKSTSIIGIDEAGRGPLAGPVAVAAVCVSPDARAHKKVYKIFRKIRDSKKLSAYKREKWFKKIKETREHGLIDYAVSFVGPIVIDRKNITYAISTALKRSLKKISADPHKNKILLDGGLKAPKKYIYQKTIIKGDEKERMIAVASIVAKVTRDRKMVRYAKRFEGYNFEKHKGYGTQEHYHAIDKHGLCKIHRRSFLTK